MKYKTHNETEIDPSGTHLQGRVEVSYEKLVGIFGEPMEGDEYKVDAEWLLEFEDGTVATIYNYKDGKSYDAIGGLETEYIVDWHIGGMENKVVSRIKELL